jgi:hypothetical protein
MFSLVMLLSKLRVGPKMKVGFETKITPRTITTQNVAFDDEIRVLNKHE